MLQQILADPSVQAILLSLLALLSAGLVGLILSLLSRLAAAAGFRLSNEQWALIRTFVQAGIRAAEEWAADTIKNGGKPPSSTEKLAHAVQHAKSMAPPKLKLDKMPEEKLVAVVQAELPAERQRMSLPPPGLPPLS